MQAAALVTVLALCVLAGLQAGSAHAQLAQASPEEVGLSGPRLRRVDAFLARLQAEQKIAGAVTVVARRGRLVSMQAHGYADLEARRPMRVDDIFQMQSMTKPIATVAALMLVEEGRLRLGDSIGSLLPEFARPKVAVARADAPGGYVLEAAQRDITVLDLLTHRAGFAGGLPPQDSPADDLLRKTMRTLPPGSDYTLETYVRTLATAPLHAQPGATFRYGPATTVLGRVIEVVTGQSLADALADRIFKPLQMVDTSFVVPADKRRRVVAAYARTEDQHLARLPPDPLAPRMHSASGNLFSSAADYLRFCQMLLNGGELDGRRLLSRKSVELMTARHVDSIPLPFLPGQFFGLGVAVRKDDGDSGLIGSPGAYGWSGGYNTYFRIDPRESLILILLVQQAFSPFDLELQYGFHNTVMQSIVD